MLLRTMNLSSAIMLSNRRFSKHYLLLFVGLAPFRRSHGDLFVELFDV
jgi:hypothetical protein